MKKVLLSLRFFLMAGMGLASINAPADSVQATEVRCSKWDELNIAKVWAGVKVGFDAVQDEKYIYLGYYDADRNFTIARVTKCGGSKVVVKLPSVFQGWDSHNYISIALDQKGNLHVVGNMHAEKLIYARTSEPGEIEGLTKLQKMVGRGEESMTYPYFFRFPSGALGFSYRDGRSGQGEELINEWDGSRWVRVSDRPVFAAGPLGSVSAYHTRYLLGRDGYFHVAWVWRRNPNVETNFNVNYARSRDLRVWEDSYGKIIRSPITPETSEIVDAIPEGSGLLNNIQISSDGDGRIIISYIKFDVDGHTQVWTARREDDSWVVRQSTNFSYRWDFKGGGTILPEVVYGALEQNKGELVQSIRYPEVGAVDLHYDKNLQVKTVTHKVNSSPDASKKEEVKEERPLIYQQVKGNGLIKYRYSWRAYPEDNRDLKRDCRNSTKECDFQSDLILFSSTN